MLEPPNKKRRIEKETLSTLYKNKLQRVLPDVPFIFSSYVRAFLHSLGIGVALLIIICLLKACSEEVGARYRLELLVIEEKAKSCHYKYTSNNCGPNLQGAIWQQLCREWDACRQNSMQPTGKAKIATRVFGELLNTLVEPLTLKSMVTIAFLVFGFFVISSFVSL